MDENSSDELEGSGEIEPAPPMSMRKWWALYGAAPGSWATHFDYDNKNNPLSEEEKAEADRRRLEKLQNYAMHYGGSPMTFNSMFPARSRCTSSYCVSNVDKQKHTVYCNKTMGHAEAHQGRTDSGLTLLWSTAEGEASHRPPPREVTQVERPLIGWRVWDLEIENGFVESRYTGYLQSLTMKGYRWRTPLGTTKEERRVSDDSWPSPEGVDRGVYSYKTPLEVWTNLRSEIQVSSVIGRIDVFGHVFEHQLGYRSQYAMIRELWVVSDSQWEYEHRRCKAVVPLLMTHFGCEVHLLEALRVQGWAEYMTKEEKYGLAEGVYDPEKYYSRLIKGDYR